MRKIIGGLLSLLVIASAFSGCASDNSKSNDSYSREPYTTTAATAYDNAAGFSPSQNEMIEVTTEDGAYSGDAIASEADKASTTSEFESKVIKNANLAMESLDVNKAYAELLNFILSKGGTEFSRSMNSDNDETTVYATFKVLPETLDEILNTASDFADIISSNVSSNDITSAYYDSEIRLETKRKSLEKYYEYLSDSTGVEEMLLIQNQIDYLTSDIEAYEGQLRMWDSLVNQSTISVTIYQAEGPEEIVEEEIEWDTLTLSKVGKLMKNGFTKTCNAIFSVIQWLLVIFVSLLPVLVLIAIAVVIIVLIKKSGKKQHALSEKTDAKADEKTNE